MLASDSWHRRQSVPRLSREHLRLSLRKSVELNALVRIDDCELEERGTPDVAHDHIVGEVKRPRVRRADARRLQAGLRVDEEL